MERPPPGKVEDLATLAKLDEKVLLDELKIRYYNNDIYTYVGDILIAVNPFRDLGIYDDQTSNLYNLAKKTELPPHIFAIADSAYQCMIGHGGRTPENQCILISGESGAGKTESTKLIIKQLVELCHGNTQLEQQILQVNPLLEAFGNAQTLMNDNSSRFGKYIQLQFHNGQVLGAKISEYLLEKSRLVHQGSGEETFHIFYYMMAGLPKSKQEQFCLTAADKYRYLACGTAGVSKDKESSKKKYDELLNALDLVGFTDEEQYDMFTMVTSVLHLGNITFEEDDKDASYIPEMAPVDVVAKLLGVDSQDLAGTMTSIVTHTRGEQVTRHYTKQQAEEARDAVAKILYGRLFGWIVNKVNQLLAPTHIVPHSEQREIGILDIFGFEHFEKNSFEQACINLANEQLQYFFNHHVFKQEQEEYSREGIDWKEIKFVDNQPLLDLFLGRPLGILTVLDEESKFPRATEKTLVAKFNEKFGKVAYYKPAQSSKDSRFTILHYAGQVTYSGEGWLEKNRDTLPPGVMEMLQSSNNALVKSIFKAQVTRTGSLAFQGRQSTRKTRKGHRPSLEAARKRKLTVGGQFKNSLQVLMERMTSATPIFIRCLKPNHVKAPGSFDMKYIQQQLLYTGMLETTKIRREGFAVRPSFEDFVNKYKVILCKPTLAGTRDNCIKILKATGIKGWQVGKTKVFLKYYHIDEIADVLETMGKSAITLQRIARGFLGRRQAARRKEVARQQAQKVAELLSQIDGLSMKLISQQQTVLQNDKNIPQSFFGRPDSVLIEGPPPPVPDFPYRDLSSIGGVSLTSSDKRDYLQPKTFADSATQASDSEEDEISDDEFIPVPSTQHPGHKMASVRWFQETQATQIYDPSQQNFIAEWFHGVISRRQSEMLLKEKPTGTFLIRVSESRFGYTLSFRAEQRVRHYMIDQLRNKKFIIVGESKVHKTLKDLIEYLKDNKLSNWDGYLVEPCGQESGECDYGELVNERFYFTLEEQIKRQKTGKQRAMRESSRPLPPPPENWQTPPLPDRNYSLAKDMERDVSKRPLPPRPAEAYQRLLHNQTGRRSAFKEAQHNVYAPKKK
ncbi:myosin-IIIb-like isoform X2 [Ruditapes philippinarum]|uniref:myosin-IIIb-like isoform X2 n=1 Tax=Ruditapes philippinarum TaxID=129788 RepID=UPI00295ACF90|nr:myosin-IIIb-like isoform X2 [Ruditapes philippinarum]